MRMLMGWWTVLPGLLGSDSSTMLPVPCLAWHGYRSPSTVCHSRTQGTGNMLLPMNDRYGSALVCLQCMSCCLGKQCFIHLVHLASSSGHFIGPECGTFWLVWCVMKWPIWTSMHVVFCKSMCNNFLRLSIFVGIASSGLAWLMSRPKFMGIASLTTQTTALT